MAVRVVSRRTVRPAPRPRSRIPLTTWDVSMLSADYIQKGLLYAPPPFPTARLLDHLEAALAEALAAYYPVAGRLATEPRPGGGGGGGCSLSIDCDGQGVDLLHAVADDGGVAIADAFPPDADVPRELVQSFFPLGGAVNHDGHHLPLLVVQVTDLADGVFLAFAYNHALSDGTALWDFLNVWAGISRARLSLSTEAFVFQPPLLERWSPDSSSSTSSEIALPFFPDLAAAGLIERLSPPPLRERMLHFSAESLAVLKERAREELLAAGDSTGAAAVTRFQALTSLVWRCVTRARLLSPEQTAVCHAAIDNRSRLRPPLPREYFGNCIDTITTEAAVELLERGGHGWAAAAVGRAVASHTDAEIRAHVAAWTAKPVLYTLRHFEPTCVMMASSPRFDMYGCDFGWGPPMAARSGRANKLDGQVYLYPGREGGIDAELSLTPDHMARLEEDDEFWAAVTPLGIDSFAC